MGSSRDRTVAGKDRIGAEDAARTGEAQAGRQRFADFAVARGIAEWARVATCAGGGCGAGGAAGVIFRTFVGDDFVLQSPISRNIFGVTSQRKFHLPVVGACSKQTTPAFLISVKTRDPTRCAARLSRCGAWPKTITSFARRRVTTFTISAGFAAGFNASLTLILFTERPSVSAKISAVCAART